MSTTGTTPATGAAASAGRGRLRRPGTRARHGRVLRDRGRALLAAGLTLLACGVVLGFVDLVRIGAVCLALVALARLALVRPAPEVEVQRTFPHGHLTVDHRSRVVLDLAPHGRRGLAAGEAEDTLDVALGASPRFAVPSVRPGGRARVAYDVRPTRRGRHRLGPLTLLRTDPFELGAARAATAGTTDVLVLPHLHDLTGEHGASPGGDGSGESSVRPGSSGALDDAIRGYRPGDDLRRVYWPVTAHRGELMVREESAPTRRRATLVLDPPSGRGPGDVAALDWAVEALASVAVRLSALGHELRVVTPESIEETGGDAAASRDELEHILRTLAVVEPATGDVASGLRVRPAVASAAREGAGEGGVLVAAVFDADPLRAHALLDARPPGTPGLLFVLDTDAFTGPPRAATRSERAAHLAAQAVAGGWHARVVRGGDDVAGAWADLVGRGAA